MWYLAQLSEWFPARNWTYDLSFLRTIIAVVVSLILAFLVIRIANKFLPKLAERITDQAAVRASGDKLLAVRRTETLLNVVASVARAFVILLFVYIGWRMVNPGGAPLALIGAGTVFVIVGVATVSPLLRDIMNGIVMISERWYEVGDYVTFEPLPNVRGVVEQVNLRSTKLRRLNGEIIWVHNQHIQGVRVVPRGLRTIAVDIFVENKSKGKELLESVTSVLPTGPALIATPLTITGEEHMGGLWRITATGQTTPGREWLIKDFAVKALTQADAKHKTPVMMYDPITRYADESAERRFLRSIRVRNGHDKRSEFVTKVEEV